MNYYENKQGKDIRDWFMEEAPEKWIIISMFNALKYIVRAGKKEGNTQMQDYAKMDNYMEDYIALTGIEANEAYDLLDIMVDQFNNYDN